MNTNVMPEEREIEIEKEKRKKKKSREGQILTTEGVQMKPHRESCKREIVRERGRENLERGEGMNRGKTHRKLPSESIPVKIMMQGGEDHDAERLKIMMQRDFLGREKRTTLRFSFVNQDLKS